MTGIRGFGTCWVLAYATKIGRLRVLATTPRAAPFVSSCDALPIPEPAEHDLDPVAPFEPPLVGFHGRLALLSPGSAGAYYRRVASRAG